jgi:BMFP domain-containing protein YqiC
VKQAEPELSTETVTPTEARLNEARERIKELEAALAQYEARQSDAQPKIGSLADLGKGVVNETG